MIEAILPAGVAVHSVRDDPRDARLFPEEEALIARSVDKRRREFTGGRICARAALEGLGFAPRAIGSGSEGEPLWPPGVVGSITHCEGYRACAVARDELVAAIGIDAEPADALPPGVLDAIAEPGEVRALAQLTAGHAGVPWDRVFFSAKESVFKSWFPLTRRRLGFDDATVAIGADGTFTARVLVSAGGGVDTTLHGRWLACDGLVLTAIAVPR